MPFLPYSGTLTWLLCCRDERGRSSAEGRLIQMSLSCLCAAAIDASAIRRFWIEVIAAMTALLMFRGKALCILYYLASVLRVSHGNAIHGDVGRPTATVEKRGTQSPFECPGCGTPAHDGFSHLYTLTTSRARVCEHTSSTKYVGRSLSMYEDFCTNGTHRNSIAGLYRIPASITVVVHRGSVHLRNS